MPMRYGEHVLAARGEWRASRGVESETWPKNTPDPARQREVGWREQRKPKGATMRAKCIGEAAFILWGLIQ
jgi:hypothetical protein